jgi:hypothetical protein
MSRFRRRMRTHVETETSSPVSSTSDVVDPPSMDASPSDASPEDTTERDHPPPYSAPPRTDSNPPGPDEQYVLPGTGASYLDPTLNFTAAQMERHWIEKDVIFARAVVQFIAERFDGSLKSWAGYKYTYICEVPLGEGVMLSGRRRTPRGRRVTGMIWWGTMHGAIAVDFDKSVRL